MMDNLRLATVVARVVAWHNGHPLARRISAAHVHAVGYVGLPFVGAAGAVEPAQAGAPVPAAGAGDGAGTIDRGALEAGAAAPAADTLLPALATLQADFSEDFIDPLSPRTVARFAARAGQVLARPPGDGPVREVSGDGAHPGRQPVRVYLLTAVIETGTRKTRMLLGAGPTAPVLGRRILDPVRVTAWAGLTGLVVGVPAWLLQSADLPPAAPQGAASEAASPASAAWALPALSAASAASAASAGDAHVQGSGTAPAGHVAASAAAPVVPTAPIAPVVPVAPVLAAVSPGGALSIRPVISDEDKARARQAREAMGLPTRAAASAPPAAPPAAPPPPAASAAPPARPLAPFPNAPVPAPVPAQAQPEPAAAVAAFALTTRPLRTRAEAEQVQVAMRSLLRTLGAADVKVDVLPQGDDWRVVALPFPQRAAADKARALLVSRGMRVEVIDF